MSATTPPRQAHAALDLQSRRLKGRKIEQLLGLSNRADTIRILEVGTGSGGIAHYFATHPHLDCDVTAVDVKDNRRVTAGYRYQDVEGVRLPFADGTFDVVLSNHVIEHVGEADAQTEHLCEIGRVLKQQGEGYLAVPNRWMLVEPHYRLALLSWWPRSWRSRYLQLMGKGDFYDVEPLQMRQLENMLVRAGLQHRNLCIEACRVTFEIERPDAFSTRLLRAMPDTLLNTLRRVIPTLIYRVRRKPPVSGQLPSAR